MKTNKLQVLYMLITSLLFAIVFGALVGGDNAAMSYSIATLSFVGGLVLSYGYSESDRKKMAMACGAISAGVTLNCEDPLVAGVVATFYLANKDDIASITYDAANPMLATDITMKAGKFFYKFEGQLQSTEPLSALVKGKYVNQFEHTLGFLIFNISPSVKKEILNMKDGNFVAIVENNYVSATGDTKYEIYGAGMRELYETGWMHNRVRMIVASFLVKHLRIHWLEGEKYFRDTLLDFNLANNVAGWQWVAGTGADAAPYFRIFNPILQGEKFDAKGYYIKKWCPELKNIPDNFLHKPWEMPKELQNKINVIIGKNYPFPIVNHEEARNSALKAFKELRR